MNFEAMKERLFPMLVTGDRVGSRAIVAEALDAGVSAEDLTHECYWPLLDMINTLYRQDKMASLAHHYSTRLLRSLVDQAQANYKQQSPRGRSIMLFCGETEVDDLAAQMVADLAEADGYTVNFGGGGVSWDEIMNEVNTRTPDVLLLFSSAAVDAPNIRILIDSIRDIGACPGMQIAVGGGVFNRAEGLAQEISADLWATTPRELVASWGPTRSSEPLPSSGPSDVVVETRWPPERAMNDKRPDPRGGIIDFTPFSWHPRGRWNIHWNTGQQCPLEGYHEESIALTTRTQCTPEDLR